MPTVRLLIGCAYRGPTGPPAPPASAVAPRGIRCPQLRLPGAEREGAQQRRPRQGRGVRPDGGREGRRSEGSGLCDSTREPLSRRLRCRPCFGRGPNCMPTHVRGQGMNHGLASACFYTSTQRCGRLTGGRWLVGRPAPSAPPPCPFRGPTPMRPLYGQLGRPDNTRRAREPPGSFPAWPLGLDSSQDSNTAWPTQVTGHRRAR